MLYRAENAIKNAFNTLKVINACRVIKIRKVGYVKIGWLVVLGLTAL